MFAKFHMDCRIKNNVTVTFNNFSKLKNKLKMKLKVQVTDLKPVHLKVAIVHILHNTYQTNPFLLRYNIIISNNS